MSTTALTCPSSFTSWTLAQRLLRRGHEVRLLCRSCRRVAPLLQQGAQVVEGNLLDPTHVSTVLEGATTAYVVTPGSGRAGDSYEVDVARSLARVIELSDVGHIVYLSALGAERPGDVAHLQSKAEIEQILLDTGRDVTVLRPGVFLDNLWLARRALDRGVLATPMHPESPFPAVTAADVALVALQVICRGPAGCRSYDLTGPEDVTPSRIAAALGAALDRTVTSKRLAPEEFRSHLVDLGLSDRRAGQLTRILVDYDTYRIEGDRSRWVDACAEFGITATHLESFAEELAHAETLPVPARQAVSKGAAAALQAAAVERGTPEAWVPGNHF